MGLSIHYCGKFNKNAVLSDLITKVKEIAEAHLNGIIRLTDKLSLQYK